jgi:hypothetical protein
MPWNPANMQRLERTKNNLYPYLSQSGPKMREPTNIPIGKIENKVPEAISSRLNFSFKPVATYPNVIRPIPKSNMPVQAAKKISFGLNIPALLLLIFIL